MEHLLKIMHRNGTIELEYGTAKTKSNGEEIKCKSFAARSRNNNPNFRKNLQANATVAYCQNHLIDDGTIL
ncbi:MAG TPA: hypothetical protein VJ729_14460 [Nitrososphaeraceae archaeon]|nr:hypothetical protein [Nitrososphaeraceae archaeon]